VGLLLNPRGWTAGAYHRPRVAESRSTVHVGLHSRRSGTSARWSPRPASFLCASFRADDSAAGCSRRSSAGIRSYVSAEPGDNPIIQTALTGKADCVVTADKALLALGKVQDVEIISLDDFAIRLPPED
jgi:hypothetical protein